MVLVMRFWALDPFLHLPEAPRVLTIGVALALAHNAPNLLTLSRSPADICVNVKPTMLPTVLVLRF